MRQIGVMPRELNPDTLGDHLIALGMKSRIVEAPGGWQVWIIDENHLARAKAELDAYLAQPNDPRFQQSARAAEAVRRQEAQRDREYRRNFREVSDQWSGLRIRRRPLTLFLVLISAVVFVIQQSPLGGWLVNQLMIASVQFSPDRGDFVDGLKDVLSGEIWRLVTPIFLHFGLAHIVMNCWAIMVEGTLIESSRGTLRLGVLVLVSAVLSNLGQFIYMDRTNPSGLHLFGGLSGVGFALFGYLWMKGRFEPEQGMILHPNSIAFMLIWMLLCMTGMMGPIANAAHVIGLVVGMVFGLLRY